ncbi:MAG: hypothetical protein AAFQ88_03155 [Pseudomonadota bacterium]
MDDEAVAKAGRRRTIIFLVAYPTLFMGGLAVGVMTVFAVSLGLRDGFCYPGYAGDFALAWGSVLLLGLPLPLAAAALAHRQLRDHPMRRLLGGGPIALILLAWCLPLLSEMAAFAATRAHCALGPPEVQDNTAPIPEVARYLFAAAPYPLLLAALLAVAAMMIGLREGQRARH